MVYTGRPERFSPPPPYLWAGYLFGEPRKRHMVHPQRRLDTYPDNPVCCVHLNCNANIASEHEVGGRQALRCTVRIHPELIERYRVRLIRRTDLNVVSLSTASSRGPELFHHTSASGLIQRGRSQPCAPSLPDDARETHPVYHQPGRTHLNGRSRRRHWYRTQ